MRNCVVVSAQTMQGMAKLAYASHSAFCARTGSDYVVYYHDNACCEMDTADGYNYRTFNKFDLSELFTIYDRVLRLDVDTIVLPSCPDLFQLPAGRVYCSFEDLGSRRESRLEEIERAKQVLGDVPNWGSGYFNSGVLLVDAAHQQMFQVNVGSKELAELGPFKEQTLLNWNARKCGYSIQDLGPKFNRTRAVKDVCPVSDAWILHFAGPQKWKSWKMRVGRLVGALPGASARRRKKRDRA